MDGGRGADAVTVAQAIDAAAVRLGRAGVAEARADAEVLAAHVLATTRSGLVLSARRPFPRERQAAYDGLVTRRAGREPVHYLVGAREFWSLPFAVDRRVLIPRPETETVVEVARRVAPGARRVLDVGTGSGAIAAALARELGGARVWASDLAPDALAVARVNLGQHAPGVRLVCGDLLAPFRRGAFDLIVANPPYVADGELVALAPEIRDHEPRVALAGGRDGLAVLGALVAAAPAALAPGGWLVIEVGWGQAAWVRARMADDGRWDAPTTVRDGGGVERVLAARRRDAGGRGEPWRGS
jgi:release factor glutamine methyltransferase